MATDVRLLGCFTCISTNGVCPQTPTGVVASPPDKVNKASCARKVA